MVTWAVVAVMVATVDVVVGTTATGVVAVVAVVTGMTPPAGVAAPPHTIAAGRATETASQALG